MIPQRHRSFRRCVWFAVWLLCGACGPCEVRAEDRTYGQYTLDEWHQVVKVADVVTLANPIHVDGLIAIIKDEAAPQPSRRLAAQTLGRIGEPAGEAVSVLAHYLTSPGVDEVETRLWALKGLALFGNVGRHASDEVKRFATDRGQPYLVRVSAMDTLGRIGGDDPTTVPTFLRIIAEPEVADEDRQLRMHAVEALWYLGPSAAPALPVLIRVAGDDWPLMRLAALTTIGEIGPRAEIALSRLVDTILFDDAGEVREAAADALGKIGSGAVPAISQLLEDSELEVGKMAIRACRQFSTNQQVQRLLETELAEDRGILRVLAADALLNIDPQHRKAMFVLLKDLSAEDREIRRRASEFLLRLVMRPGPARENFVMALNDESLAVEARQAGQRILERLGVE